ncbi:MAG: hypothetical protein J6C19_16105 [Lachnospiraceae bacterium]|nr:hypothetical protein [Lachnospiraceae bacterium]
MKKVKNEYISLYAVTFILSVIPALFYTAPAFEDGLGTMGTAAYLTGHDWSAFLAADGYYYKYGQALWYILPFALIDNAVIRYKVMLAVNSMLTSLIPLIVYRISCKYIRMEQKRAYLTALIVGWMPSILLYNKYTWAETNLMVLPWVILLLQCKLCFDRECCTFRKCFYSALLALAAVYTFMSHQRGLVVVLAATITTFILWRLRKNCISMTAYLAGLTAGLFSDRMLCAWQKAQVYAGAVMEHNTLADFLKPELYHKLLSWQGVLTLIKTGFGWLYHSVCSTFGLAFIGIVFMVLLVVRVFRRRTLDCAVEIVALQGILSFLGAFALGLLFFFESMYHYFDGTEVVRCDHLLFGRYLESTLPILLYMGLIYLINYQQGKMIQWLSAAVHAGLVGFTAVFLLPRMQGVDCYVHSLAALNLFMDTSGITKTQEIIPNYSLALFAFGIFSLVIGVLIGIARRRNIRAAFLVIALVFLWIYIWNCYSVIGRIDGAQATVYAQYYLSW